MYDEKFCLDVHAPLKNFSLQLGDGYDPDSRDLAFQDAVIKAGP
jgi:hypothetical protein